MVDVHSQLLMWMAKADKAAKGLGSAYLTGVWFSLRAEAGEPPDAGSLNEAGQCQMISAETLVSHPSHRLQSAFITILTVIIVKMYIFSYLWEGAPTVTFRIRPFQ